jgi:hypothetical protein
MAALITITKYFGIALLAVSLAHCDKKDEQGDETPGDDNPDEGNDTQQPADMGGQPEELQWFSTCGDPVCSGYGGPWEGVPACGEIKEGDACQTEGETCDFMSGCNARLICAAEDPKQLGCPRSRAELKQNITYVDPAALAGYYRDVLDLRLATYQYRDRKDGRTSLGVILEDGEGKIWADSANDRVDLYGYSSLAIAGVQVQAAELAELRAEMEAMQRELAELRERCGN